jgi:hypothetical protein
MKQLGIALVLALGLMLSACGSSSSSNVNGNWTATLTNADGSPAFGFTTSLTQNSDSTLSVTNLSFTTSSACFPNGATATGGVTLSGTTNGITNGGFQLILSSSSDPLSRNVLTLNGTIQNSNTITGNWTLAGIASGCSGNGNFTMTKM